MPVKDLECDINLVDSEMIKELLLARYGIDSKNETIDIVSGGAPCESFRMAGKRIAGDKRDDLFSNITRIARATKSKAILFENLKKGAFAVINIDDEYAQRFLSVIPQGVRVLTYGIKMPLSLDFFDIFLLYHII